MKIKYLFSRILDILYPPHIKCIFCGNEIANQNEYDSCDDCLKTLPRITHNYCSRCGAQQAEDFVGVCLACKKTNYSFEYARSVFKYSDYVQKAILKLKFGSGKYLLSPLSKFMTDYLSTLDWEYDYITFVPMHPKGLKKRKYNQSEELAKLISKKLNKPIVDAFEKIRTTKNQAQLSASKRKTNLKDAFRLKIRNVKGKSFLIIDDVFTTGSTSNELSKLLKSHKASKVYVFTLAHSSLKSQF